MVRVTCEQSICKLVKNFRTRSNHIFGNNLLTQRSLSQDIIENINVRIMQLEATIKDIRATKKLSSEDIAIYTINKEKTIKLRINNA